MPNYIISPALSSLISSSRKALESSSISTESEFVKAITSNLQKLKVDDSTHISNEEVSKIITEIFNIIYKKFSKRVVDIGRDREEEKNTLDALQRGFGVSLSRKAFTNALDSKDVADVKRLMNTFPESLLVDAHFLNKGSKDKVTYGLLCKLMRQVCIYAEVLDSCDDEEFMSQIQCFSLADKEELHCLEGSTGRLNKLIDGLIKNPLIKYHGQVLNQIYTDIVRDNPNMSHGMQVHILPYIQFVLGLRDAAYLDANGDGYYKVMPKYLGLNSVINILDRYQELFTNALLGDWHKIWDEIESDDYLNQLMDGNHLQEKEEKTLLLRKFGIELDAVKDGKPVYYFYDLDDNSDGIFGWNKEAIKAGIAGYLKETFELEIDDEQFVAIGASPTARDLTELLKGKTRDGVLRVVSTIYLATQQFRLSNPLLAAETIYLLMEQSVPQSYDRYQSEAVLLLKGLKDLLPETQRFKIDHIIDCISQNQEFKDCVACVAKKSNNAALLSSLNIADDNLLLNLTFKYGDFDTVMGALRQMSPKEKIDFFLKKDEKLEEVIDRCVDQDIDAPSDLYSIESFATKNNHLLIKELLRGLDYEDQKSLICRYRYQVPKPRKSCLRIAVENHDIETIKVIMETLNSDDLESVIQYLHSDNKNILDIAAENGYDDIINLLLGVDSKLEYKSKKYLICVDLDIDDIDDNQSQDIYAGCFYYALKNNQPKTIRAILDVLDPEDRKKFLSVHHHLNVEREDDYIPFDDQYTYIHLAAMKSHIVIKEIMDGLSPDEKMELLLLRDGLGKTPLDLALIKNNQDFIEFITKTAGISYENLRELIFYGEEQDGITSIMLAILEEASPEIVSQIFGVLSPEDRMEIINIGHSRNDGSVWKPINYIIKKSDSKIFKAVWDLLSEKDRMRLSEESGYDILWDAIQEENCAIIREIALTIVNNKSLQEFVSVGTDMLKLALMTNDSRVLVSLLQAFPQDDLNGLMTTKIDDDKTFLDLLLNSVLVDNNTEVMKAMIDLGIIDLNVHHDILERMMSCFAPQIIQPESLGENDSPEQTRFSLEQTRLKFRSMLQDHSNLTCDYKMETDSFFQENGSIVSESEDDVQENITRKRSSTQEDAVNNLPIIKKIIDLIPIPNPRTIDLMERFGVNVLPYQQSAILPEMSPGILSTPGYNGDKHLWQSCRIINKTLRELAETKKDCPEEFLHLFHKICNGLKLVTNLDRYEIYLSKVCEQVNRVVQYQFPEDQNMQDKLKDKLATLCPNFDRPRPSPFKRSREEFEALHLSYTEFQHT